MSLILKGIDLPTKKQKTLIVEIAWDGDVWVDNHDRYELKYNSAIQIPKDHGNIIDESKAVVTGTIDGYYEITAPTILKGENHEPNVKRG